MYDKSYIWFFVGMDDDFGCDILGAPSVGPGDGPGVGSGEGSGPPVPPPSVANEKNDTDIPHHEQKWYNENNKYVRSSSVEDEGPFILFNKYHCCG